MFVDTGGINHADIVVSVFFLFIAFLVGSIIWAILRAIKGKSVGFIRTVILTFVSFIIVAVSWMLNFGWIRLFMTVILLPFAHAIFYIIANLVFAKFTDLSVKMSKLNLCFIISYVVTYVLLPDGGDVGGAYFFFGLIHSTTLSYAAELVSGIAFVGHIVLFIIQIIECIKIMKSISSKSDMDESLRM